MAIRRCTTRGIGSSQCIGEMNLATTHQSVHPSACNTAVQAQERWIESHLNAREIIYQCHAGARTSSGRTYLQAVELWVSNDEDLNTFRTLRFPEEVHEQPHAEQLQRSQVWPYDFAQRVTSGVLIALRNRI